ncbi:MAG TPA: ABC transporter permease [Longimicrobiales bacterium]|nr:ABC transporter permease [Longimicrobiales bacterium]
MNGLYRALMRLYPASFRRDYGDDMCAVFGARVREARGPRNTLSLLRGAGLLASAVFDVAINAPAVHWEILRQDLRYARRALARARGFAVTAILVTALGVGANTAAFSVADFVLVRPLPFSHPDRLVRVWEQTPGYTRMELSPANYRDLKAMTSSFQALGVYNDRPVNLVGGGPPRRVDRTLVSPELLDLLGVPPLLGRVFAPDRTGGDADAGAAVRDEGGAGSVAHGEDDAANAGSVAHDERDARSVVLSYGLWQSAFGGDPGILGRTVDLEGVPYQVIGVMPADFHFPTRDVQLWTPLELKDDIFLDRTNNFLQAVGRLKGGVTLAQAQADVHRAATRLAQEHPRENARTGANVYTLRDDLSKHARVLLLALCGAALCILLLACANLANLLLARAAAREREIAVRAALGAGRERLVRQMITESVVLAVLGGVAGIVVAAGAVQLLAHLVPADLPIAARPTLDLRVLALAGLFTAVTGLGFGVLPALRAGGRGGLAALRDGGRGGPRRRRLRTVLVGVEVAASVVLLVSAGLLVRAMWRIESVDPGFRDTHVLTLRTALPWNRYAVTQRRAQFYRQVLDGVRALPDVTDAAYTTGLPLAMKGGIWPVTVQGREVVRDAANSASLRFVTPQYFATLGIPLRRGRGIRESDRLDQPSVAVVSESFARRYWPDGDAIGKHFPFAFSDRTVVGIAGDVRVRGLDQPSEPQVYLSYQQVPDGSLIFYIPKDLVVRSTTPPAALLPAVRRIVRAVDPDQPISNVQTMTAIVAGETASRRAQLDVFGALALLALLLAGVGIHGLLAFTVSQRSREIGVRMALGARRPAIARMVLKDGLVLAATGAVPGIVIAYAAGRAMRTLLAGVQPGDPATLATAVGLAVAITLLGSLLPALRAARVSPMDVMRNE